MGLISTATDTVRVDEGQFYVFDALEPPNNFARLADPFRNGLIGATTGAVMILTGIASGQVTLTLTSYSRQPQVLERWEERNEVLLEAPHGDARVTCWDRSRPTTFFPLSFQGVGDYHLRLYARGRNINRDGVASVPHEKYLIQVWSA